VLEARMKLYRITWLREETTLVAWAGTITDAKSKVKDINEGFVNHAEKTHAGVEWCEYEFPTNKAGILHFLNTECCVEN
jgi:hypothetical protein